MGFIIVISHGLQRHGRIGVMLRAPVSWPWEAWEALPGHLLMMVMMISDGE